MPGRSPSSVVRPGLLTVAAAGHPRRLPAALVPRIRPLALPLAALPALLRLSPLLAGPSPALPVPLLAAAALPLAIPMRSLLVPALLALSPTPFARLVAAVPTGLLELVAAGGQSFDRMRVGGLRSAPGVSTLSVMLLPVRPGAALLTLRPRMLMLLLHPGLMMLPSVCPGLVSLLSVCHRLVVLSVPALVPRL